MLIPDSQRYPLIRCPIKYELDIHMFQILKTGNFQLWVFYERDLRISTAGKYKEIIRIKHLIR